MSETTQPITCIGFIMDGNRRWAKDRDLPTLEGHRQGVETCEAVVTAVHEFGIPHVVLYAFSSENWRRDEAEVSYLLGLFTENLKRAEEKLFKKEDGTRKVRFRCIGDIEAFGPELQERITSLEETTKDGTDLTAWIALSYGGRAEVVSAVNKAVVAGEEVTAETFETLLWTSGMPDPDIIVRTGGQKRLSNFLPWQSVYSELFFTDTLWPDLTPEMVKDMCEEFTNRKRNFGK